MTTRMIHVAAGFAIALICATHALADQPTPPDTAPSGTPEITLNDWLVIEPVGDGGRAPVHADAIEAEIVADRWQPPHAGDTVTLPDRTTRTWQTAEPEDDGWLNHAALSGGYAYASAQSDTEQIMLLAASGHSMVYVNGVPRTGDPYRTGWVRLPVTLQAGMNTFLFRCGRGGVRAGLVAPAAPVTLDTGDLTLPDLIVGEEVDVWGAIPVINATPNVVRSAVLETTYEGGTVTNTTVPPIPALTTRKAGFRLRGPAPTETGELAVRVRLLLPERRETLAADTKELTVAGRGARDRHKRTFVSEIDGSVQYYAVTPAHPNPDDERAPAMFLTLHGASVEATGQAGAYGHKDWGHIVAPTNRRPFGFDWEDWGRLDAMEVLALASQRFGTDPRRTYLTGHSMGGHGVWHVGATFPDRFAAIAPSAGWISFWSYAGAARIDGDTAIEQLLGRATSSSDTLALSRNYLHHGVYILHGELDDNVPVEQARQMRAHLADYHTDFAYYERPGAGHWWGNACVDWPPLFDFLGYHENPAPHAVRHIEFVTANPAVSASSHWAMIEAQIRQLDFSTITIDLDPKSRKFSGTTENVARLSINLSALSTPQTQEVEGQQADATVLPAGQPLDFELDGQTLAQVPWPEVEPRIWLTKMDDVWAVSTRPASALKGPHRYGPFKHAFRNRFVLVYATGGTDEENAWAVAKARYDAETFWYRGNGSVDVIPDTEFDAAGDRDRNVIIYGNAATNAVWSALLGDSPVQVLPGKITVGEREFVGNDLACLTIWPRPRSDRALVGIVGGTGPAGMRLTDRLPYFVSGVAYPDTIVLGPQVLTQGVGGVKLAGYFGNDWRIESGEFAEANE